MLNCPGKEGRGRGRGRGRIDAKLPGKRR